MGDHDRPLNDRGNRDAPRVGSALAALYREFEVPFPGWAWVSSACRTKETAGHVVPEIGSPAMEVRNDLYLASPGEMMRMLVSAEEKVEHLLILAHNPGSGVLANLLSAGPPLADFPTCCAVCLRFEIDLWGLLEERSGERLGVIIPREL